MTAGLLTLSICDILPVAFSASLARPSGLIAGLLIIIPILIAWRARRKGSARRKMPIFCQCVALLLAAAALAGPEINIAGQAERAWLILQDISGSLRCQKEIKISQTDTTPVVTQPFAAMLYAENQPADESATNLSPALNLAASRAEAGTLTSITILTDGQFCDAWQGPAKKLGNILAKTNTPLQIIPLDAPPKDARIIDFKIQRSDESQKITATILANATLTRKLKIRRTRPDSAVLFDKTFYLEPGLPTTIHLSDNVTGDQAASWRAELWPTDDFPENDTTSASLSANQTRTAVVAPQNANMPPELLKLNPADAPTNPAGWSGFSTVILAEKTGELLNKPQRQALADYVKNGGGLVIIGTGPAQTPADLKDPLNKIAALVTNPFTRKPIDLIVILDASGSMAKPGRTQNHRHQQRFELAAEAAISLREHLTDHDRLKVITFADEPEMIYDSGQAGPNFPELQHALKSVKPAGATKIEQALKMATREKPAENRLGLVLVLSDLQTAPFNPQKIAERFRQTGWALAVVAVGQDESAAIQPIVRLATLLNTPLVRRDNLLGLAKIFGQLCRQTRGEIFKHGTFSIHAKPGWEILSALKSANVYAPSTPTNGAEILGTVSPGGNPALACKQTGLGRCYSLAFSPIGADNPQWTTKVGLKNWRALILKLAELSARPETDSRFKVKISNSPADTNRNLKIHVYADENGSSINGLNLRLACLKNDDSSASSTSKAVYGLPQIAPGEYGMTIPNSARPVGLRIFTVDKNNDNDLGRMVWQGTAGGKETPEFKNIHANYHNLRKLALLTGGRLRPALIEGEKIAQPLNTKKNKPAEQTLKFWPVFLTAALIFMLIGWYRENW